MNKTSFFPNLRKAMLAATAISSLTAVSLAAQTTPPVPATIPGSTQTQTTPDGTATTTVTRQTDTTGTPTTSVTTTKTFSRGKKKTPKEDKVVATKDTKKELRKNQKVELKAGADAKLPDKQLYDKATVAIKKGHYDVARLDLQTMLNTYPDSQYQMRAKLAIADSWFKEGGTAALTQAESEYADFRVFFPNVPEAAEAQMRIGDIYFKQMDKPDRDYSKSLHAEEEYRRMLTDYPDSTLINQAKQRLREVQEVLATREDDIAAYYATRENWAAVIARYQTVVDTYPLYSRMDDTLIGLGDAYEAQARYVRGLNLPASGKEKLEALYDSQATEAYRKVVTEHAAAAHVEDARDRLAAMNQPIPEPTPEQMAASVALENSRGQYTIGKRATQLFMHSPDTVLAASKGDPTMTDPKPTVAPVVVKRVTADFNAAFNPAAAAAAATADSANTTAATAAAPAASTTPAAPAAPLAFQEVGTEGGTPAADSTLTAQPVSTPASGGSGIGVEILTPGASSAPAAPGYNYGLKAVRPPNADPLPATEKAAPAPDRPNEVTAATPAAQAAPAKGKKANPSFDKSDESSSKHRKKKGLKKIIEPL